MSSSENGLVVDGEGTKIWYKNGQYHREDGPAIVYENGDKFWYQKGGLHREDGPAVEWADGRKGWYRNGIFLGRGKNGFWKLWELLTEEQKGNPNLLKWIP